MEKTGAVDLITALVFLTQAWRLRGGCGKKAFPGATLTGCDDSTTTDFESHGHFHELIKGDCHLHGIGYDSAASAVVHGGIGVNLKFKTALEIDIPVTE